jgi:Ser/Thr protein kinase RdoA (MazF antagonist)
VRRATDGRVFAPVGGGRQVRVYGWVDLGRPDPGLDPGLVGAAVAAVHRVGPPADGPVDPWYTEPIGDTGWDRLVGRLRAAGAPFAGRLAALRDELVALETWLRPPENVRTCHRDLWADNVLPTAQGGICVIDWENSGPADPGQELACALFEFGRSDPGRARALMSAYAAEGGPATVTRPGDFSMLIAQFGHIAEIAATDWLEPNVRNPDRAGAEAWIGEILDEPHTRDVLTALLTAIEG